MYLNKLFWFQWENHSKSMKLEAQTLAKIKTRINEKVMGCCGTWIDWQYLLDAAALLAKCRYTLQYTYPYAYYMEPSPRKELVSDKTYEVSWYDIDLTKNAMHEMSTGCSIYFVPISNGHSSIPFHISTYVVKTKIGLRSGSFVWQKLQFWRILVFEK